MKKSKITILAIIVMVMLTLSGFGLGTNEYRLKGTFEGLSDNHIVVLRFNDMGNPVFDTISHKNGTLDVVLKMSDPNPIFAHLSITLPPPSTEPGSAMTMNMRELSFFISQGSTITLKGHVDHLNLAVMSGGAFNDELAVYNALQSDNQVKLNQINDAMSKATGEGDRERVTALRAEASTLRAIMTDVETQFIADNPNSPQSAFLYSRGASRRSLEELETDFAKFGPDARNSVFGQRIAGVMEAARATAVGVIAPNFTLTDRDGNTVSLTDYRGKYVIISFWGSWCAPCRQGHPALVELYHQYKDRNFDIIGLAGNELSRERWLQAIETDGLVWRQFNLRENDRTQPVARQYNVTAWPTKLLLDPQGRILAVNRGPYDQIKNILAETFK